MCLWAVNCPLLLVSCGLTCGLNFIERTGSSQVSHIIPMELWRLKFLRTCINMHRDWPLFRDRHIMRKSGVTKPGLSRFHQVRAWRSRQESVRSRVVRRCISSCGFRSKVRRDAPHGPEPHPIIFRLNLRDVCDNGLILTYKT
jgi:hypothetical protein